MGVLVWEVCAVMGGHRGPCQVLPWLLSIFFFFDSGFHVNQDSLEFIR